MVAESSAGRDFRFLQTENGLPDGEINSIVQDSTGNMWFATWTGLIKYDGYYFEVFRPELGDSTSLPEKKIKQLFVDSRDNLWVVTSSGLCRLNKQNNTFITCQFEDVAEKATNIVQLFEMDEHLLVQAVEGFFVLPLQNLEEENSTLKRCTITQSNKSLTPAFNYSASFANRAVLVNNNTSSKTSELYFTSPKRVDGLFQLETDTLIQMNGWVNDVEYVPMEQTIYLATTDGVRLFSMKQKRFLKTTYFKNQDVQHLLYASNHHIYASLPRPALLYIDLHTGMTGSYTSNPHKTGTLLDNEIHSLYEDFSGNLWIGHQGQGISIMDLHRKKFYSFMRDPFQKTTLNSNTVMCFNGTENEIFIGCRNNGLNIVAKKQTTGNQIIYKALPLKSELLPGYRNDGIWDIAKQSDSLFWVGTDRGLYRLFRKKSGWALESFSGNPNVSFPVRKIFIDSNNNLWCGSHNFGLVFIPNPEQNKEGVNYRFEAEAGSPESLSDNVILDIFLDSKKRFWIGTNNGFNRLDGSYENLDLSGKSKPALTFVQFVASQPLPDYLNNNEINCFYENYDGQLWIATQGGGINIFNPETEKFSHLTTEDGLPSNDVISMLPDEDGNLWIATSKGLARYNRFGNEPGFTLFNSADGIQSEIFMINSSYKAADGQLFFGGDRGFTCFYPREIEINEIEPKVALTQFRIRNRVVELGDTLASGAIMNKVLNEVKKITLPFKDNNFSIGVSSIHFQSPENNQITYILEGSFETWYKVPAASRFVYFSNIPPGTYTFRARAISADGLLSGGERSMIIEIRPPWYGSPIAIIMYVIAGLFFAWGIVYILTNWQKLIYQKKIDKIALENNENKMLFLTNIAHELRTPMSLIIAPVEDMVRNMNVEYKWKNHLQLIARNSGYLLRLANQSNYRFQKIACRKTLF